MCPTLTVGNFFRRVRSTFLFNNLKPQQLQTSTTPTSEARPKRKEKTKQTSRTSKTHEESPHSPTFFGTMRLFETFWIAPKGHPFICFDILQHNGCRKIAKGPPFYIFRHSDTVQKSHFKKIFGEIFSCLQRVPFNFFSFFAASWSFTKPEGSPLFNFEP